MNNFSISDLPKGAYIHMIGIGGISMSGIAEMLLNFGYKVSGATLNHQVLQTALNKTALKYLSVNPLII